MANSASALKLVGGSNKRPNGPLAEDLDQHILKRAKSLATSESVEHASRLPSAAGLAALLNGATNEADEVQRILTYFKDIDVMVGNNAVAALEIARLLEDHPVWRRAIESQGDTLTLFESRFPALFALLEDGKDRRFIVDYFEKTGSFGWTKAMLDEVGALRMDLGVYREHVLARPDRAWRLVSMPCAAAVMRYGIEDSWGFWHSSNGSDKVPLLTLKCPGHVRDKEKATPESQQLLSMCVPVPFHPTEKTEEQWAELAKSRGSSRDGVDGESIALLSPALVKLGDNYHATEGGIPGDWTRLVLAHVTLRGIERRSQTSGEAAKEARFKPAQPFGTAVEIGSVGALGDALMGRRTWKSAMVKRECKKLRFGSPTEVQALIELYRDRITGAVAEAWVVLQEEERRVFKEKSFFASL
ncbi:hypothetical protein BDY21DRAFT_377750 [Lineolata rhizophorae]|uniref:Uncharacterized protein n=1 Tax=Lineolata rhizophorae TaxID=578093 RepID=A0A6A6P623_9PEZI|nr:hypothetical protein BDY21DRAFT_377750 [Lineolata rhizophorae]